MNRPNATIIFVAALLGAAPVAAESASNTSITTAPGPLAAPGALFNEIILKPSLGEIFFNDFNQFAAGLLLDLPAFHASNVIFSIGSGFLYSALGSSVSETTSGNRSIVQIPADLKIAVHPQAAPALSVGPHVGANVIYTSGGLNAPFGSSAFLTTPGSGQSGSGSWQAHPNVGADLDYAFSSNLAVSLRYDATLMSAFNLQTLTFGLGWVV